MHEMSLCESVFQIIENEAREKNFTKVKRVIIDIGVLSGVEIPAFEFAFEAIKPGSIAETAELEINELAAQAWCMECAEVVTVDQRYDPCPKCGSYQLQINSGDELKVKELEVD